MPICAFFKQKVHFFAEKFAHVIKKQYFCTRFYVGSDLRRLHRPAIRVVAVLPPFRLKHRFASVLIG